MATVQDESDLQRFPVDPLNEPAALADAGGLDNQRGLPMTDDAPLVDPKDYDWSQLPGYAAPSTAPAQGGEGAAEQAAGQDDWLTDDLLRRAVSAGVSKDEARSFGSAETLQTVIRTIDSRFIKLGEQALAAQQQPATAGAVAAPARPAAAPAPAQQQQAQEQQDQWPELDDDYDEKYRKAYDHTRSTVSAQQAELEQLRTTVDQLRELVGQEYTQRAVSEFDEFCSKHKELFGEGSSAAMNTESSEFKNRQSLDLTMRQLAIGHNSLGQAIPKNLIDRAFGYRFGTNGQAKQEALREVGAALDDRSKRVIAEPTSAPSGAPQPTGGKSAEARWRAAGFGP